VRLKPHFLERDVAYQKIWLEPHFDNHCASIAKDSIEVRTEHAPAERPPETFGQMPRFQMTLGGDSSGEALPLG
jgi:hypothetical protein